MLSAYGNPDAEVLGSVGKGLLVIPGQWARLSNISEKGTWLRDEQFSVGDKTVVRKKGESVGRILLPYRKLRKECPELLSKIDIMSQPAANVDSVILSWVIQEQAEAYPCSVWMSSDRLQKKELYESVQKKIAQFDGTA